MPDASVHLPTHHTKARVATPVPERVDVAVIGAGLGGLMTAAKLARSGRSVAVLDAHYVAGGCATMFGRGSGDARYAFDIGLHYVGDCGPGGRLPAMLAEVGVEIDWRPLDPDGFDELVFPDLRFRVPASVERYRDRLVEHFPKEKRAIDRFVRVVEEVRTLGRPDAPKGWRMLWEAATRGRLAAQYKGATLKEFLDGCTQDPRLRAVLAGQNGDYGLPPSKVSLMLHAGLVGHYLTGAWYPRGGGQVIADALAERIEAAGGTIHLRHPVTGILVEGGRAAGITWKGPHGGEGTLRADVVVSNADLKRTIGELLPASAVPLELARTAQEWTMGGAIFLTCLAVRADLSALGNRNLWAFDHYDFDALYAEGDAGGVPPVRGCYVTSATQKDPGTPGHAPPGVETVEIMALVPGGSEAWGVPAAEIASPRYRARPEYLALKQRVEDELVARLERLLPGSTRDIVYRESATPVTHSRFTGASGGSGYGLAATPGQFLDKRPGARGHLPGLFYAGGNLRSGHGISGALSSGRHAARAVEKAAAE